ncbi:hypothetical protein T439DRAFT_24378 [Meredithblackwellia eburnea MCA 4105]
MFEWLWCDKGGDLRLPISRPGRQCLQLFRCCLITGINLCGKSIPVKFDPFFASTPLHLDHHFDSTWLRTWRWVVHGVVPRDFINPGLYAPLSQLIPSTFHQLLHHHQSPHPLLANPRLRWLCSPASRVRRLRVWSVPGYSLLELRNSASSQLNPFSFAHRS